MRVLVVKELRRLSPIALYATLVLLFAFTQQCTQG